MNGVRRGRTRLLAIALLAWGVVVVGRLVQLQIARGPQYRARAQKQQQRRIEVSPRRGAILDREGRELAVSVEVSSVYAIPEEVEDPAAAADALGRILPVPREELAQRLRQPRAFVWVHRKIDPVTASAVRELELRGIRLVPETKRFYPKGNLAAAVLGFVGTDDKGLGGLEHFYDETIRGKPGEIIALTDARRSTYGEAETTGRAPEEGASLALSLDSGIQFAAERELEAGLADFGARSGAVVLLDPITGEILAMASAPGFDPNRFNHFSAETRRNRALADAHEPGSTFKIVTGALALEESLVAPDDVIETGDGTIRIANTTISEHDGKRFGPLTLAGVFEHSSNVGIIRVGLRLGPQRLYQGARAFGLGDTTGVDLPGENRGIFRPLARWSALSNAEIAMGQEVSLTPLQLARIGAVVANGGLLVRPRLMTRVLHPDGRVEAAPASPPVRVLSAATARKLRDILVGVVLRGTGTKAAIPGFVVGGKTGTAQKAGIGGYLPGRYVPAFVGFAPAENPRVVGVVVIEEPHGRYHYGGDVAAPIFARVVSQALAILRVAPEEQRLPSTVLASLSASEIRYPPGVVPVSRREGEAPAASPAAHALEEAPGRVPSAFGLSAREALSLFARRGAAVKFVGTGFVVGQSPAPGAAIRPGSRCILSLSEDVGAAARSRAEEASPAFTSP